MSMNISKGRLKAMTRFDTMHMDAPASRHLSKDEVCQKKHKEKVYRCLKTRGKQFLIKRCFCIFRKHYPVHHITFTVRFVRVERRSQSVGEDCWYETTSDYPLLKFS